MVDSASNELMASTSRSLGFLKHKTIIWKFLLPHDRLQLLVKNYIFENQHNHWKNFSFFFFLPSKFTDFSKVPNKLCSWSYLILLPVYSSNIIPWKKISSSSLFFLLPPLKDYILNSLSSYLAARKKKEK